MKKIFTMALLSLLLLPACKETATTDNVNAVVSFDEVMASRRSIRKYDATKTISEKEIKELLTAVQDAPSWANQQPTRYYVALSDEKKAAVAELLGGMNKKNVEGCSALIVTTFERGRSGFFNGQPANEIGDGWGAFDTGLSVSYLVLKARAMGFDTLIMGMRDGKALSELLGIPESQTVMSVVSLGYRAIDPQRPGRMPIDEMVKIF